MAKNDNFHNLTVGGVDVTTIDDLSTHAGIASGVHGIADTDTIAGLSDIDTHAGATAEVHGIEAGDSFAATSDLSTHAGLASDVHGIADTDTIAGQSDIDMHASAVEDVHGVAAGDAVAGLSDITAHADSVAEVHGIAAGDAVAAQSAVDAKADDPHDNTAHSTAYSAEGHDHANETLLPDSIHYQTLAADPAAPASGAIAYYFDDGTNEEIRAINSAGEVITIGTFA